MNTDLRKGEIRAFYTVSSYFIFPTQFLFHFSQPRCSVIHCIGKRLVCFGNLPLYLLRNITESVNAIFHSLKYAFPNKKCQKN